MTSDNSYPIREIFRKFYPSYLEHHPNLPEHVKKVADCIRMCKTGELGHNVSACANCKKIFIHNVSCNNRHCPNCQAPMEKKWEMERQTEVIGVIAYYHVVFTLPHELNDLIKANMAVLLNLLFQCVHETLLSLCAGKKFMGAKPGILSVLHTWGQRLSFHPHLHVCISGGGLHTRVDKFIETRHKGFFIPEAVLAESFRGKYLCALKELYRKEKLTFSLTPELADPLKWKDFINNLFEKRWLPFVKETFNGNGNAVKYLARYSFRTAISNNRIVSFDDENVSFRYKDYQDHNQEKIMTVKGEDFIGLFLQHVLPKGFNRIRFAGFLANSQKAKNLKLIHWLRRTPYSGNTYRDMSVADLILMLYKHDIRKCPLCHHGLCFYPRGKPLNIPSSYSYYKPEAN